MEQEPELCLRAVLRPSMCAESGPRKDHVGHQEQTFFGWNTELWEGKGGRGLWGCVRNDHLSSRGFEFNGETGLVDIDPQSQISRVCQGLHESGWHLGLLGTAPKSNYSNFFFNIK